jgi:2-polyprenyl-3-methyl-5-hydroxy-6-metoxy-1,4-benzoquinol methylase
VSPTVCPLCHGGRTESVLRLDGTPVYQHVTGATAADARSAPRGDVTLALCLNCGFVFNSAFEPARVRYSPEYENSQDHSEVFTAYLDALTTELTTRHRLAGKTVVEIGCGQGSFLERLTTKAGCVGVGFDPTFDPGRRAGKGSVTFIQATYDPAASQASGHVVFARHVIEHISNPQQFMDDIGLAASPAGEMVWFETPRLEWILERGAFWDIFYEHCSYFAMPVLAALVSRNGWHVTNHRSTFGAQYQWIEASRNGDTSASAVDAAGFVDGLRARMHGFGRAWASWKTAWRRRVEGLADRGTCVVWGAGAKGVAFLNQIDSDGKVVHAVVDVNPRKQGRYVPGTGHAIVAPLRLQEIRARTVLVANSNYLEEIREILRRQRSDAQIVSLDRDEDL